MELMGTDSIVAQTDTSYNNPPKGRSFSQPATQSFTPLVECLTTKQHVIAIESFNKHCKVGEYLATERNIRRLCPNHPGCTMNFNWDQSMDHSEFAAAESNCKQLVKRDLHITGLVTDGAGRTSKAHQGFVQQGMAVERLSCVVHLGRGLMRKAFSVKLSPTLVGDGWRRTYFLSALGTAISTRISREIYLAKKMFSMDDVKFQSHLQVCRDNLLNCFEGKHTTCTKACQSRRPNLRELPPSHLPYKKYLKLNSVDRDEMQKIVNYRLNEVAIGQQRYMISTNRSESLHLRILHGCPKSKLYQRNYSAKNHSNIHTDSVGIANSIIKMNLNTHSEPMRESKAVTTLQNIQYRKQYHKDRQQSLRYRKRRSRLRWLKMNRERVKRYTTGVVGNPSTDFDHTYFDVEGAR